MHSNELAHRTVEICIGNLGSSIEMHTKCLLLLLLLPSSLSICIFNHLLNHIIQCDFFSLDENFDKRRVNEKWREKKKQKQNSLDSESNEIGKLTSERTKKSGELDCVFVDDACIYNIILY